MADGIYTAPERIERDGKLLAFAGETMTMAEAVNRGIVASDAKDAGAPATKAPARKTAAKAKAATK